MFKQVMVIGLIASGLMLSTASMAAPRGGYGINAMQAQQARMIERGIRSGALTPYEARVLWAEQRAIRNTEARYRVNGLSRAEFRSLRNMLLASERHIINELRDGERVRYRHSDNDRWQDQDYRPTRQDVGQQYQYDQDFRQDNHQGHPYQPRDQVQFEQDFRQDNHQGSQFPVQQHKGDYLQKVDVDQGKPWVQR